MAAHADDTGTGIRLRWWALALPAAAFAALLTLLLAGPEADAAAQRQPLTELLSHVRHALLP